MGAYQYMSSEHRSYNDTVKAYAITFTHESQYHQNKRWCMWWWWGGGGVLEIPPSLPLLICILICSMCVFLTSAWILGKTPCLFLHFRAHAILYQNLFCFINRLILFHVNLVLTDTNIMFSQYALLPSKVNHKPSQTWTYIIQYLLPKTMYTIKLQWY